MGIELNLTDQVGQPRCSKCGSVHLRPVSQISATGVVNGYMCVACEHRGSTPIPKKVGVRGEVTIQLIRASDGEVVHQIYDPNVFTDVGRNWLSALISYATFTQSPGVNEPASSKRRYDGVRYMMVGTGTQLETNSVDMLNTPVAYNGAGDYLAQVVAPNELPGSGISAVFQRTYGVNEISMPTTVYISEVGLYPSGIESAPLSPAISTYPPLAYKTFEPVPKTTAFLFAVRWELKF